MKSQHTSGATFTTAFAGALAAARTTALAAALAAVPLAAVPLAAAAAEVPASRAGARDISRDASSSVAREVSRAVRDVTREVTREAGTVQREATREVARDVREITSEVRDLTREVMREVREAIDRAEDQRREDRRGPDQTERVTKSFKVGRTGVLDLSTFVGTVTIAGGAGEEIAIDAVKRVRAATPEEAKKQFGGLTLTMTERAGRVEVRTEYSTRDIRGAVDFTIKMPADGSAFVKSMSGDIKVTGVKGELRLDAVSGDVVVSGAGPIVRAKSMSGDLQVSDVAGDGEVSLNTMSGTITVQKVRARSLEATGISGDVYVTDVTCERATLHSTSGDLQFAGPLVKGGRYEFRSHSGDVTVAPVNPTGFEVEASTFSGTFKSDFPVTLRSVGPSTTTTAPPPKPPKPPTPPTPPDRSGQRPDRPDRPAPPDAPRGRDLPGRMVQGTYGDASSLLFLASFSGDVTIVKK